MTIILSPFAWLLNTLHTTFDSYGIAIIVFAVVVKVVLFPFSLKGKRGMIQMNMLSGKVQAIKVRCGKDNARYQQEVTELYAKEKINPMSGCLWTFLPLFVLIPLYTIIRSPIEYMLFLDDLQILELANYLQWDTVAVAREWTTESAIASTIEKNAKEGFELVSGFANSGNNQLLLASLIPEGGVVLADGTAVQQMNFHFLGIDLSQIPNWKLWKDLSLNNLGTIALVAVSALTGVVFSKITQKTNKMSNQPRNEQMEQTNRMMMITMPLMSVWIGFIMPAIMCLYWVANNLLSMVQELIAGKILKADYEKLAIEQEKQAQELKLAEKEQKQRQAEEREKRKLEEKQNKGKKKPKKATEAVVIDKSASREGMRQYARGRAYDPNRYPSPTRPEIAEKSDTEENKPE